MPALLMRSPSYSLLSGPQHPASAAGWPSRIRGSISGLSGWTRECAHGSYEATVGYVRACGDVVRRAQLGSDTELVGDLREAWPTPVRAGVPGRGRRR